MQAFTVSAAARVCGVDRRTLQRAIQAGRLPLDAQHCLSREVLMAAGYLDAVPPQETPPRAPQDMPQNTPHGTSQDMPLGTPQLTPQYTSQDTSQDTSQELVQATALLALLERLTTAITDLHEEVRSLREDLRQRSWRTPQERRRGASVAPQSMPHGAPQSTSHDTPQSLPHETPQTSPQSLGLYDPRAAAVRIRDLRRQGLSYTMIALRLTQEGIPTRYGKPWEQSSVRYVLETYGQENAD
jgi:Recombinase